MTDYSIVVQMHDLEKYFPGAYGNVDVLKKVNVSILYGEFVALTGPSGSGKSTFLHLAGLLDLPTAGSLLFDGKNVSDLGESELNGLRKEAIGMIFQNYYLLPNRSVLENVLFRFRYIDHDPADTEHLAWEALEMVGLTEVADRRARLLSGGEMQRVAIARAIALKPRLLVADEPTGNLDSAASAMIMGHLQTLNRKGVTILLVTHNESLLDFCTRHLICRDGHIEEPRS
jgi:putative ABC transport system ATP-binding protein